MEGDYEYKQGVESGLDTCYLTMDKNKRIAILKKIFGSNYLISLRELAKKTISNEQLLYKIHNDTNRINDFKRKIEDLKNNKIIHGLSLFILVFTLTFIIFIYIIPMDKIINTLIEVINSISGALNSIITPEALNNTPINNTVNNQSSLK